MDYETIQDEYFGHNPAIRAVGVSDIYLDFEKRTIVGRWYEPATRYQVALALQAIANHILICDTKEYVHYDEGRIRGSS